MEAITEVMEGRSHPQQDHGREAQGRRMGQGYGMRGNSTTRTSRSEVRLVVVRLVVVRLVVARRRWSRERSLPC